RLTPEDRQKLQQAEDLAQQVYADAIRDDWRPALSYTANLARLASMFLDTGDTMRPLVNVFVRGRRADAAVAALAGPQYPWYWSAGILAGLFGLSLWILKTRVRSLDRLR